MDAAPNLRADAFAGTADAYLRYRPPYPAALLDDLVERARLGPRPVLADLACGPGRVALALAARFDRVWALDLEPEMIEVGAAEAARRGVDNISWIVGRAEEAVFDAGAVDLITIGEAFHRLDQTTVIRNTADWLKPGGSLVTLGTEGLLAGGPSWKTAVAEVAHRWMAKVFPTGWAEARPGAQTAPDAIAEALGRAGFSEVETRSFSEPWAWSFDAIVGYLRSTSVCSDRVLGAALAEFEAELRSALGGDGPFREQLRSNYTIARKPD
jgi:SAM-dependent methyltransferase